MEYLIICKTALSETNQSVKTVNASPQEIFFLWYADSMSDLKFSLPLETHKDRWTDSTAKTYYNL